MIYEQLCSEKKRIEEQLALLQAQLNELPEGKLIHGQNKQYMNWYANIHGKRVYINKHNIQLAQSLAVKKYLILQIEDLTHALKALDKYLVYHQKHETDFHNLLDETSCYSEFLISHFNAFSSEIQNWMTSYEKSTNYPEHLIHKTISGHIVRSKSESLIATALFFQKIPFRYECALNLNDTIIYPDFTIRHPQTGKIFYWEHFGKIDDPSYFHPNFDKLKLYASNGIYPSINLITTFETKGVPLDSMKIDQIIHDYFI